MKILKNALLLSCVAGFSASASAADSIDKNKFAYLQGLSGKLTAYCGAEPTACETVVSSFNQHVAAINGNNDFNAKFIRLSTSEMMSRIKSELEKSAAAAKRKCAGKSGQSAEICKDKVYKSKVDVAFYGTDDPYKAALEDDIFSQHKYPKGAEVYPWASSLTRQSDNRLGALYMGVLGLGVNTDLLGKYGVDKPSCWKDLENPDYKGRIVIANWNTSGTAYKFAATMMQAFDGDESKGWNVVEGIHKNIAQYTKSGSKGVKMAARGETLIGIGFGHDIIDLQHKGFPVELVAPCEGTLFEVGPVGIIRGAKNRKAAEAFTTFLYESGTQELLASVGSLQFPSNVDANIPQGAEVLSDANLIASKKKYSIKRIKNNIIKKWTDEVFPSPR